MENGDSGAAVGSSQTMFDTFRIEIDEHHDRRERVIKGSKDITAYSKKVIFALQRTKDVGKPLSDKRVIADITKLKAQIKDTFTAIAPDLQNINAWRYQRQISGGIQEYMEAVLFEHYLRTQLLMTYEEAATTIPSGIRLTYEDYALGLFDMTGELMKIAITYMATNGRLPGADSGSSVLMDMQTMRTQLELMDVSSSYGLSKDFDNKLKVAQQSVQKVEASVYSMTVRGKERPPGWKPDLDAGPRQDEIESY